MGGWIVLCYLIDFFLLNYGFRRGIRGFFVWLLVLVNVFKLGWCVFLLVGFYDVGFVGVGGKWVLLVGNWFNWDD